MDLTVGLGDHLTEEQVRAWLATGVATGWAVTLAPLDVDDPEQYAASRTGTRGARRGGRWRFPAPKEMEMEMEMHHEHGSRNGTFTSLVRLVAVGLAVAAVVKELRLPSDERTWHGTVAGVVPYEFRRPTVERFRERVWDPEAERIVGPHVFGVGWTLNVGRLAALVRERLSAVA